MKKILILLPLLVSTAVCAGDSVTITSEPGMATDATSEIIAKVEGQQFEKIRKQVEVIVQLLGKDRTWSNLGPDASYQSAKIELLGQVYTITSWHPLYTNNDDIAVSEKWGLTPVSGKKEKIKVENQNSKRYRSLIGIFKLCENHNKSSSKPPVLEIEEGTKE